MPQINLSETELAELINIYESSLRKLYFQVQMTEHTIQELKLALQEMQPSKAQIKPSSVKVSVAPPPTEADAPEEEEAEEVVESMPEEESSAAETSSAAPEETPEEKPAPKATTRRKPGPKPGKKKPGPKKGSKRPEKDAKGYRLSDWDQFVLDTLAQEDRLLSKAELDQHAEKWVAESGKEVSAEDRYNKIARVLHKLANRHERIKKFNTPGRGYSYALPEWFFTSSGELKTKYRKQMEPEVAKP